MKRGDRISQTREYIFTWVVVCPPSPTPNVIAPLVYIHTLKYFELQTAFQNAIDYWIVNCKLHSKNYFQTSPGLYIGGLGVGVQVAVCKTGWLGRGWYYMYKQHSILNARNVNADFKLLTHNWYSAVLNGYSPIFFTTLHIIRVKSISD